MRAASLIGSSRDRIAQLYQRSRNSCAPVPGRLLVDLLEGEADLVGARGLEMQAGQRREIGAALGRQRRLVAEPEIAAALELRPALALGAADLVDGVVDELDGVELVEGDLGLGEVVGDALDEGGAHVDAHLLDVAGIAVVGFEIVGERLRRCRRRGPR